MLNSLQELAANTLRDEARELARPRPRIKELRRINDQARAILAERWPAEFPVKECE